MLCQYGTAQEPLLQRQVWADFIGLQETYGTWKTLSSLSKYVGLAMAVATWKAHCVEIDVLKVATKDA